MPMSLDFFARLEPLLPWIVDHIGTPFHIYNEQGIRETGERLKKVFRRLEFREFFAVKALPNPAILCIMRELGFGFDCSSIPELVLARAVGAKQGDIMFTSNNTAPAEYREAFADRGCILNLDDITFVEKVPGRFPELICFRYNPGSRREGVGHVFGKLEEQKYGVRHDQIVDAYQRAIGRGAKRFGIHTMIISNQLDYTYMVETVQTLLSVIEMVSNKLGIIFEFMNIGGGIGIPYKLGSKLFNMAALGRESRGLLDGFRQKHGYAPKLFLESGRYMTGPHGVLVTRVINRMSKYREYVGVDACMSSLMRPGMYRDVGGGYHHITVPGKENSPTEVVDVVGSLCENNDKFAVERELPVTAEGDILLIHDTGAHGHAMGFNYNGRLRPPELLLCPDGKVKRIRRSEKVKDLFRTLECF